MEMKAGAEAVARNERLKTLNILEKRGLARIIFGFCESVRVGDEVFENGPGPWPSELLMARVALAIEGGMHRKKE